MHEPSSILSLADVPGLSTLRSICVEFNVEITLFGSVVRRLYKKLNNKPKKLPDLYDLNPLLSDIDLKHSGAVDQTSAIRNAILGSVQGAECFRWEIRSETELAEYAADEVFLPVIPANKLQLDTMSGRGITDKWDGMDDIQFSRYRLFWNGYYDRSQLRWANRDIELLHALMYLYILMEDPNAPETKKQPGWNDCRRLISVSRNIKTVIAIQESAYLRSRIRYRLKAIRASGRDLVLWKNLTEGSGLIDLLDYFDQHQTFGGEKIADQLKRPDESPLVSSCRLGGDVFRLADDIERWDFGETAQEKWELLQAEGRRNQIWPMPDIAEGERIIAASPTIPQQEGVAKCSHGEEHVHFQVPWDTVIGDDKMIDEKSLGVLLVMVAEVKAAKSRVCYVVSLSGCCLLDKFKVNDEMSWWLLQVRLDCGRLLEVFPRIARIMGVTQVSQYAIRIFITTRL